jgi:molybdate transport system regulatory protein
MARLKLKLQLYCGDEIAMGPGKADLLEAIARTGSISAAGRALGMSYRRAWLLVDTMNRCFSLPLVETRPGGGQAAGARLTAEGEAALAAYRGLSEQVERGVSGADFVALESAIRPSPAESTLRHPREGGDPAHKKDAQC